MTDTSTDILEGNAKDVIAALGTVEDLAALKASEEAGKNRAGVLSAIDAEISKRANTDEGNAKDGEQDQPESSGVFVLDRNFGDVIHGKHIFYEAGKEFNAVDDAETISYLHQKGASISLKK